MNKKAKKNNKKTNSVEKGTNKEIDSQYDYDFVPDLNQWLDIDDQKEGAERMEDID